MTVISAWSPSIAQRQFAQATAAFNSSLTRLATGSRINRGADDPAGLIASEQLSAALASLDAESRGFERADAIANTADGALAEISSLLADANAATVAMANTAGMSQAERDAYQMEIDSAMQAVGRIASTTTFNGQRVLDGSMTLSVGSASLSIGDASASAIGRVSIDGADYRLSDVMSGGALDPATNPSGAQQAITAAVSDISALRGRIGSFQSTSLVPMQRASKAAIENTASAFSMIRDTDYAAESANLSRARILNAASMRALALANASPASALSFLR